jgi:hypothetical protein
MLMLRAYIDDSRMGQPPVYTLGGWVAPASTWTPFSDAWREILWMKPRIEYFEFDEALSLDGQFRGITEASRNEKLRLMINLIEETNLLGLVSMIPHHIFDPLFGWHPSRDVRNPYILSFFGMIANLAGYMSLSGEEDRVEFFFDYQPHSIKQVLDGWENLKIARQRNSGLSSLSIRRNFSTTKTWWPFKPQTFMRGGLECVTSLPFVAKGCLSPCGAWNEAERYAA